MLLGRWDVTTAPAERFVQKLVGSAHVALRNLVFSSVDSPATTSIAPDCLENLVCLSVQIEATEVLVCQFPNRIVTLPQGFLAPPRRLPRGHGQVKHLFQRDAFGCSGGTATSR